MSEQLMFTWSTEARAAARLTDAETRERRQRLALRRGVLRWLLQEHRPTGYGVDVVTRIARFRADIAGFWSRPVRNYQGEGPGQLLQPVKTCIIQCYLTRGECWPDCSRSQELLPQLRQKKEELRDLETVIRTQEPELRDNGSLFEEYAVWHYEESRNETYRGLRKEIKKTEHALYRGTEFERIRQAALVDVMFLAVPSGLIQPSELADGWGLLWVDEDLKVRVVAEPETHDCLAANRLHLVQNIGAAAAEAVRFAMGLHQGKNGSFAFVKPPRGHRRTVPLALA